MPHLNDALSAYLDGELSPEERTLVAQHLATCPTCANELAAVADAREWVRSLPPVEPPAHFYAAVLATRRRRAGVAALALAGFTGLALLSMRPPPEAPVSPPVQQLVEDHAATASVAGDPVSQLVPVGVSMRFGR